MTRRTFFVAAACAAAGCLTGCSGLGGNAEEQYVSPYDWTCLKRDGERLDYLQDGAVRSQWGIDVSEHQRFVDWAQVASAGVQFAFVRIGNRGATEGRLGTDEFFFNNCNGAAKVGIPLSAYFFSQAIDEAEAREEAAFALEQIHAAELRGATFQAIAYDHEAVNVDGARANDLSGAQLSHNAEAFCADIERSGYEPLLYGNQRDLLKLERKTRESFPVWLAEYDVEHPTAPFDTTIWQYTNAGSIPGVPTAVDLNIWLPPVQRG